MVCLSQSAVLGDRRKAAIGMVRVAKLRRSKLALQDRTFNRNGALRIRSFEGLDLAGLERLAADGKLLAVKCYAIRVPMAAAAVIVVFEYRLHLAHSLELSVSPLFHVLVVNFQVLLGADLY